MRLLLLFAFGGDEFVRLRDVKPLEICSRSGPGFAVASPN